MRAIIAFVVTNRLFTILFVFVVTLAALTNLPNLRILMDQSHFLLSIQFET